MDLPAHIRYPAFIQLIRLLGRDETLRVLGGDPDPSALSESQRQTLAALLADRVQSVATELVREAAASDDVFDVASGRIWIADRIHGFRAAIGASLAVRLAAAAEEELKTWR